MSKPRNNIKYSEKVRKQAYFENIILWDALRKRLQVYQEKGHNNKLSKFNLISCAL